MDILASVCTRYQVLLAIIVCIPSLLGQQTSEGASAHPAKQTPTLPPHLVHTVQGHLPSTTTAAASESLAIASMSDVSDQEREDSWLVVSQGDIPAHIEGVQTPHQVYGLFVVATTLPHSITDRYICQWVCLSPAWAPQVLRQP